MSILIAYGLIGLIMVAGLIMDRTTRGSWFDPDSITSWGALFIVLVLLIPVWPTLFTRSNMEDCP